MYQALLISKSSCEFEFSFVKKRFKLKMKGTHNSDISTMASIVLFSMLISSIHMELWRRNCSFFSFLYSSLCCSFILQNSSFALLSFNCGYTIHNKPDKWIKTGSQCKKKTWTTVVIQFKTNQIMNQDRFSI